MRKLANNELNRLSIPAFKQAEKIPVVVVLDNVRSLNNIGSVFRTADAFLVERIVFWHEEVSGLAVSFAMATAYTIIVSFIVSLAALLYLQVSGAFRGEPEAAA